MAPKPRNFNLNARTVTAPLAAFTMACLLFVYTRTSIQAAKRNAQQHREADGGQISWRNESKRRHGVMERLGNEGTVKELVGQLGEEVLGKKKGGGKAEETMVVAGEGGPAGEEEIIRARRVRKGVD
ncbi:hypothetical protein MMC30_001655 [Trapelia coarctata]|nr:hypothetical protein [Trapelia coarctata]